MPQIGEIYKITSTRDNKKYITYKVTNIFFDKKLAEIEIWKNAYGGAGAKCICHFENVLFRCSEKITSKSPNHPLTSIFA